MIEFELRPARLREDRLVVDPLGEVQTFGWRKVLERLAPSGSPQALSLLRLVRQGWFIGTRRAGRHAVTFVLDAAGKSNSISNVLKKNPMFGEQLIEVFYVERAEWGAELAEAV